MLAQCRGSSIRTVISLKVVSMRLRHSAMTLRRMEGMSARCLLPGGTRTAWAAANALPLKPLSASRCCGADAFLEYARTQADYTT